MTELPSHLTSNEREAVMEVTAALSQSLGDNLVTVYLFGSKARGDARPDSDIDLLVIVQKLDADSRWLVRATAADCSLQHDVLFNTHIYEKERWEYLAEYQDALWREIQRDGVSLHDLIAEPSP